MACRAVVIKTIEEVQPLPEQRVTEVPPTETIITETVTGKTEVIRQKEFVRTEPKEVTKIIVKKLLTECDYFNMMRKRPQEFMKELRKRLSI